MSGWIPSRAWLSAVSLFGLLTAACASGPVKPDDAGQVRPKDVYFQVLPRSGGGQVRFENFRGKVLMIDFFATWSQPSFLTISNYSVLHARYEDRGLAVVGVAVDELGDDVVAPYAAGMQIPYPVALATGDILQGRSPFGDLPAVPTLMIFDRSGNLIQVFMGLVPIEQVEEVVIGLL